MMSDSPIRWTDPATWSWMFYVWVAFALAGLAKPAWNWLRRQRADSWLVAKERIESVEKSKPGFCALSAFGTSPVPRQAPDSRVQPDGLKIVKAVTLVML